MSFFRLITVPSWTAVNSGLTNSFVNTLAASGANLFAGTGGGVFLSTNNGTSSTTVNTGLTNNLVGSLAVSDTNLFAGTVGSGVWKCPLSEIATSVERASSSSPEQFVLAQNYPNPFNPSTTIYYALPVTCNVRLVVFNTLGQQVARLVNQQQTAGWQSVEWRGKVSSGVYFYRIEATDVSNPNQRFVETRKMLMMK